MADPVVRPHSWSRYRRWPLQAT